MKKFAWILLFSLLSVPGYGGVNLRNGNFYIQYTDMVVSGVGSRLELSRTYNSTSDYEGWFGYGFGSLYETYISIGPDGSVTVNEFGSGARVVFLPMNGGGKEASEKAADEIIEVLKKKRNISKKVADQMRKDLIANREYLYQTASSLGIKPKISKEAGAKWKSTTNGLQYLELKKVGSKMQYVRSYVDETRHHFDEKGRLVKLVTEGGANVLEIEYSSKTGFATKIVDNNGKQINLDFSASNKKVQSMQSNTSDKKATYKYSNNGKLLVESKDPEGNLYKFSWDKRNYLVKISYADNSSTEIEFNKKGLVSKVKNRNGEITEYKYIGDPKDYNGMYGTIVTRTNPLTGRKDVDEYRYYQRIGPDGQVRTWKVATNFNGLRTITTYNAPCCPGLPTQIEQFIANSDEEAKTAPRQVTKFGYTDDGLLASKDYGDTKLRVSYHPKFKRMKEVKKSEGEGENLKVTVITYDYYDNGNPRKIVENVSGRKFDREMLLVYKRGNITQLITNGGEMKDGKPSRQVFNFTYRNGQIVEAAFKAYDGIKKRVVANKVNFKYGNEGQMKGIAGLDASTPDGQKASELVVSAFRGLMSLLRPLG